MTPNADTPAFSIKASGDGYEILCPEGEVVAWTLDRQWALRIVLALEQSELQGTKGTK
jgi:hypothetical protein